jgi:hypothetical protein
VKPKTHRDQSSLRHLAFWRDRTYVRNPWTTTERLDNLRRSLAMLPPQAPSGLSREDAMRVIAELQDAQRRLERLKA